MEIRRFYCVIFSCLFEKNSLLKYHTLDYVESLSIIQIISLQRAINILILSSHKI